MKKIFVGALTCAVAVAGATGIAKSQKSVTGYGHIANDIVVLARTKEISRMLKGDCGIRLTDIVGVTSNRGSFGGRGRTCDPNAKEKQVFSIYRINPGENIEVATRTRSPVSRAAFRGYQRLNISLPRGDSKSCFALVTNGKLVPVRSGGRRSDRYYFSNPVSAHAAQVSDINDAIERNERGIKVETANLNSADRALLNNRAYNRNTRQCVTPTQRAIPPKPKTMSARTAEIEAHGICVDLVSTRHSYPSVSTAMAAILRRDIIRDHSTWLKQGEQKACVSSAMYSQTEDWVTRYACGIFGVDATRGCIQNTIEACIKRVKNSCLSPLTRWQSNVNQIRAEPVRLKQQCNGNISAYNQAAERLNNAKSSLAAARQQSRAITGYPDQIDLAQATCRS